MQSSKWAQPVRFAVVAAIFLAVIWLIIAIQPLISSFIIAALIAYILHPLVNVITRRSRLGHRAAVNIIYFLFLLVLAAIPGTLTPIFIVQLGSVSFDLKTFSEQAQSAIEQSILVSNLPISLDILFDDLGNMLTQTAGDVASNLGGVVAGVSTNFLWVLAVLVMLYYLLKDSRQLIDWGISFISPAYRHHAEYLLAESDIIWGSFLRGQLLLMLIIGVISWWGSAAVGLPGAFIVGLLAGLLDIIPSLGPTLAAIAAVSVALFEGSTYLPVSNWVFALIVLAIFLIIQQIENIWIRPALMGRRLKLHPALVFVGVIGSLALFGILPALLIIPLMATIGMLMRYTQSRMRGIDPISPNAADDHVPQIEEE